MISTPVNKPKRDVFEIKASRDPIGQHPLAKQKKGALGSFNLEVQSVPVILHYPGGRLGYEHFHTADLYQLDGAKPYLLIFCPLCQNNLRISADNKKFDYDPERKPRFKGWSEYEVCKALGIVDIGGSFSTEEIACSWELEPDLRRSFGLAVCPWRAVIENNIIREV